MGLRDDILAMGKRPRKVKKVDGEPWGRDDIYVLKMNGVERDSYHMDILSRSDKNGNMTNIVGWHAMVVALYTCDSDGVKVFTKDDTKSLNETDPESIDLVFNTLREFNGLTIEADEEFEGNSEGGSGNGSSAASESNSENRPEYACLDGSTMTT
jgi:hypothetical protein